MVPGRKEWMYRGHKDYDPNRLGAISLARVAAALTDAEKLVWIPFAHVPRYDLMIEDQDRIFRVQCKTCSRRGLL
jgi:hypothetical protein